MIVRKIVAIVCPRFHGNFKAMAGARLRYVLVNDSVWYDDVDWNEYRRILARNPGVKAIIVMANCSIHEHDPVTPS